MNKCGYWIEESVLRDGAFLLLTSSSVDRYVRVAKSLAHSSELREYLQAGRLDVEHLIAHARELRGNLNGKKQREIEEVELAIVLAVLATNASEEVSDLLIESSLNDQQPLTWISALARRLYQQRGANEIVVLPLQQTSVGFQWSINQSKVLTSANIELQVAA